MKRTLFLMLAVVLLAGLSGFSGCCGTRGCGPSSCLIDGSCGTCADCPETCQPCDTGGCGNCCNVKGGRLRGFIRSICPGKCGSCDGCGDCAGAGRGKSGYKLMAPIAYPYYTVRGPRDFLAKNPPSIGP